METEGERHVYDIYHKKKEKRREERRKKRKRKRRRRMCFDIAAQNLGVDEKKIEDLIYYIYYIIIHIYYSLFIQLLG